MVSPIKTITHAMSNPLDTAGDFLSRAFRPPGIGGIPDPTLPAPAQQPTTKPARKGMQQSFLSGVAGAALGGGGGGSTGKTLLGA